MQSIDVKCKAASPKTYANFEAHFASTISTIPTERHEFMRKSTK